MSAIRKFFWSSRLPMLLLAAYWGLLFLVGHIPLPKVEYPVGNDKLAHLVAYAGLAFLFAWTMFPDKSATLLGAVYVWFCISSYGVLDEFLQKFVAGRTADLQDWIADAAGAAVGVAAFAAAQRWLERPSPRVGGPLLKSAGLGE